MTPAHFAVSSKKNLQASLDAWGSELFDGHKFVAGLLGEAYRILRTCNLQRSVPFGCFTQGKTRTKIELRNIHEFNLLKLVPVAKRIHKVALSQSEKGQISIFFSASLVVMISIVAFVINIGLFVKAKINLQNATDSAAYAGAAVQARQLSKIAYLNWEMRNIFKEWMYKYYVVGNLNLEDVSSTTGGTGVMKFKFADDVNVLTTQRVSDQFNIPTVCIHIAGSKTNICKRYSIPGLPEFGATSLPGAEEASRVFLDTLISTKVNDCVDRTRLNMSVATTWAYNVLGNSMDDSLAGYGPAILSDRQGAWPRAVELAIRMRNLEYVVNRPPISEGVCNEKGAGAALTRCQRSITEIEGEKRLGNERLIKAFYSGYRNLGNETDSEMKGTFTLSEIPPEPYNITVNEDNSLLLSPDKQEAKIKHYLDLKLMLVNYAIFYAAMIPRADTATSGACDISKVAIPVPGYPLGFYKNPEVLTYYAVKGEAEFRGMFNPFAENDGLVKMVAYSAAKPFGGRIGPMLFTQTGTNTFLTGRSDPLKRRSLPYITSYDFEGVQIRNLIYKANPSQANESDYIPGLPLPTSAGLGGMSPFWLSDGDSPLGGKVTNVGSVQFGVPNMVYDYNSPYSITGYSNLSDKIYQIKAVNTPTNPSEKEIGLFSKSQFNLFKGSISGGTISPDQLDAEIARVRAPTMYEAANYLIPTPNDFNVTNNYDSFGFINTNEAKETVGAYTRYRASIYAPLHAGNGQIDILYQNPGEVLAAIQEFMRVQASGLEKYKRSLNRAAVTIFNQRARVAPGAEGSKPGYKRAALGVSNIPLIANSNADSVDPSEADTQMPLSCESIAGQFLYFFNEDVNPALTPGPGGCPVSLSKLLTEYFAGSTSTGSSYDPYYYRFDFSWPTAQISNDNVAKKFMTAYMPGSFTGVGEDGEYVNPIDFNITDKMRRNTYSTKFIAVDSLQRGGGTRYDNQTFAIYAEGPPNTSTDETRQNIFRNPINPSAVDGDISSIKY